MRISEILQESESEIKFLVRVGGTWIGDIERIVTNIADIYERNPTPENKAKLKSAITDARTDIEETLEKIALFDVRDRLIKRIENRYTEYYFKLLQMTV
jgi:hypothetical protein